jgi:hypothetical protein
MEFIDIINETDLNKLFCTFTVPNELDTTLALINKRYSILYNKIFVLESPQSNELICTYNIDTGNISSTPMSNTILAHRKKDSNTLYTINALNALIRSLNNGFLDKKYIIEWNNYRNCILLNNGPEVRRLDTVIYKIVNLS